MQHNSRRYIIASPGKAPFPAESGQVSHQTTPTPSKQLYALPHSLLNFLPTVQTLQALVNAWLIWTLLLIAQTAPEALPNVKKKKNEITQHWFLVCSLCCCSSKPVVFSFTTVSRSLYPLLMPGLTLRICSLFWVQIRAELNQQKQLPLTPHSSQEFPGQQDMDTGKGQRPDGRKKHQTTTFKTSSSLLGEKAWLLKSISK